MKSSEKLAFDTVYCKTINDAQGRSFQIIIWNIQQWERNTYMPASTCANDDDADGGGGRLASSTMLSFLMMTAPVESGSGDRNRRSS
jgi:hypothetical protein